MNEVVVLAACSGNLVTSLTNLYNKLGGSKREIVFATKPIVSDRNGTFKTLCIKKPYNQSLLYYTHCSNIYDLRRLPCLRAIWRYG